MSWLVFSVKGLVWSLGGEVLMLERSLTDRYCPGHWELPGGKLESWKFKKNFRREVWEEAGLRLASKIIFRGVLLKTSAHHRTIFGWPTWYCTIFVSAACETKEIALSYEHRTAAWLNPKRTLALGRLTPESQEALVRYAGLERF